MSGVLFVVMSLAAYRITRLLIEDDVVKEPRDWLNRQLATRGWTYLGEMVACPWCLGAYVSILTVAATALFVSVPLPWLQMAGVSAVVGLLAGRPEHG